ncbi:MAG: cobalamin biosynthesis protein [Arcobacter sp.]|uniref:cobalt transporter CbiM n=1 Tax=uncultured Arcobacter sp. TaxID=165434 RepID=UPI000CC0F30C|nr:cobalt transporter CbiM [uncultured Arcobacter sp.]PLY08954.1 MAG: cobalamin biosynthesis protein [Arcobacter sp.]
MHISDGVLSLEATVVVSAISLIALVKAIKDLKNEDISLTAVASAMFFISSFIHIPFGVTQIHLILIGVIGILISWSTFVAIFVALLLQALLLGYGGIVSIGVNLFVMAMPAVIVHYIYNTTFVQKINDKLKFFLVGFIGTFFATLFLTAILYFSKDEYNYVSMTIFSVNTITMVIEGIVSMFLLLFIKKVYPKVLKV